MRTLALKVSWWLKFYANYGWKGMYSWLFPVTWTQDFNFVNCGYDIISLQHSGNSYFYGTWKQLKEFWR